jgi:hypothetical protein
LLERLPDWFGIPESNEEYVTAAAVMTSYLARGVTTAEVAGALLVHRWSRIWVGGYRRVG